MSMQPEHPLKPAFEKAIEWAREQEKLLSERQRQVFAAMKLRQAKEREIRQKWLDGVRAELRKRERDRKPRADLVLRPPVQVEDPQTRRLARLAIANEKRLERLDARHHAEAIKMLQKFEQERAKEKANDLGGSFLRAVRKAAQQEKDRGREQERQRDPLDRSR
jgi:hypothetical protein